MTMRDYNISSLLLFRAKLWWRGSAQEMQLDRAVPGHIWTTHRTGVFLVIEKEPAKPSPFTVALPSRRSAGFVL